MKIQRVLVVLTLVNLALLIFMLAQMGPAVAQGVTPVLRGRALEIVDERRRVRASLNVLPAKTQANGETYLDTVLLRGTRWGQVLQCHISRLTVMRPRFVKSTDLR